MVDSMNLRLPVCLYLMTAALYGNAATIEPAFAAPPSSSGKDGEKVLVALRLSGPIVAGDAKRLAAFDKLLASAVFPTLIVNSSSGDFAESLAIGRWSRRHQLNVRTLGRCLESCVLVLAAGIHKFALPGQVGLMRPVLAETPPAGLAQGIKTMRAEAKRYLAEINIPASLADAMFMALPYMPQMLSAAELRRFRLDETDLVFQEVQDFKAAQDLGLSRLELTERKRQFNEASLKQCGALGEADKDGRCRSDLMIRLGLLKAAPKEAR